MQVKDLEVFIVGNPPPGFGGRYFIFVKLTTDNGIAGVGEVYATPSGRRSSSTMIEDVFERNVAASTRSTSKSCGACVYGTGYTLRPDASLIGVLSGIEIALWDIKGKAVGKPVYELLGGRVHERLRTYTYIYPDTPRARTIASTGTPSSRPSAARRVRQTGLHRHQVRSGRALFAVRSAPTLAGEPGLCEKFVPAASRSRRQQSRPAVRHPRPVHAIGRDPAG